MQYIRRFLSSGRSKMSQKINYPSADRNKSFILEVLQKHFDKTKPGKVLEVSSGTGQHCAYFASHFPKLIFQPSEYEISLFDSIKAYAEDTPEKNVKEPVQIDASSEWKIDKDYDYMINVNMIHVSPIQCTYGLFRNASAVLKLNGLLITYGAYANNGVLEPQSNIDFDRSIRSRNPTWGVRDIQDIKKIAEEYGIELKHIYDLPANNKCLVWQKVR